jgi:hypothetical protein
LVIELKKLTCEPGVIVLSYSSIPIVKPISPVIAYAKGCGP